MDGPTLPPILYWSPSAAEHPDASLFTPGVFIGPDEHDLVWSTSDEGRSLVDGLPADARRLVVEHQTPRVGDVLRGHQARDRLPDGTRLQVPGGREVVLGGEDDEHDGRRGVIGHADYTIVELPGDTRCGDPARTGVANRLSVAIAELGCRCTDDDTCDAHQLLDQLAPDPADADAGPGADQIEWCVFYGGDDPEECAGRRVTDDQADAEEDSQWLIESGVARREVWHGPWQIQPQCSNCRSVLDGQNDCCDGRVAEVEAGQTVLRAQADGR